MSLVADLLSKIKPAGRKGEVPPALKRVVSRRNESKAAKKKIIIFGCIALFFVIGGYGFVLYMETKRFEPSPPIIKQVEKSKEIIKEAKTEKPEEIAKETDKSKEKKLEGKSEELLKTVLLKKLTNKKPVKKRTTKRPSQKKETRTIRPAIARKIAIAKAEALRKKAQKRIDLNLYIARTYENEKDYYNALDSYKKALEEDPENYIIMNNISNLLLRIESYEESLDYSKMALKVKINYTPALINSGIASIKKNHLAEGKDYLLKALSIEPSNKFALYNMALLYEKLGDYETSKKSFLKLFNKKEAVGYLGLARIAEKQGREPEAAILYREIMEMEGMTYSMKVKTQGYLGLARIAEKQGKKSEAIALYRDIIIMEGAPPNIKTMANDRIIKMER